MELANSSPAPRSPIAAAPADVDGTLALDGPPGKRRRLGAPRGPVAAAFRGALVRNGVIADLNP